MRDEGGGAGGGKKGGKKGAGGAFAKPKGKPHVQKFKGGV